MIKTPTPAFGFRAKCFLALPLCTAACVIAVPAEGPVPAALVKRAVVAASQAPAAPATPDKAKPETRVTPEQALQLFSLVDQLLKFSSDETGLPIKSTVKRQMTTRAAVESYLNEKFNEDQDAKRMQRSEIVMKKFGLLDRDFDLKPFLLSLLKEQIEAYYDPKSKTVNLLDWVNVDDQKPVLAHELTHALQDQHVGLEKWSDQTPPDVSNNSAEDSVHLAKDEIDTAREAVTEGQAMVVMLDNMLKPMGRSLIKDPEVVEMLKQQMTGTTDSPVLARAPLLLSESLMFPYREGLSFEQDVWMDQGQTAAFAGALDRPPSSSWEIINPREYEKRHLPAVPLLPDIHTLVDKQYKPYDIGQVGQLDVHILTGIFGGEDSARDLSPAWDGGIYWAGQLRNATPAEQASTKSIGLIYLSAWKNASAAQEFVDLYVKQLGRQYSGLKADVAAVRSAPDTDDTEERAFTSDEGPMVISIRGKMVFVSESFDLVLARKLRTEIMNAQGSGDLKLANLHGTEFHAHAQRTSYEATKGVGRSGAAQHQRAIDDPLTGSLVRFLSNCGVMKSAVDAAFHAVH
ncbi:MAG TPA: hypothetical protein VK716_09260 [Terracidiphilus sp.]|jgi:hypothetical protein|nr:hypothetical protein [Terracidiphilus sp.]